MMSCLKGGRAIAVVTRGMKGVIRSVTSQTFLADIESKDQKRKK